MMATVTFLEFYLYINAILTLFNFIMVWKLIRILDKHLDEHEVKR